MGYVQEEKTLAWLYSVMEFKFIRTVSRCKLSYLSTTAGYRISLLKLIISSFPVNQKKTVDNINTR